MVSLGNLVAGVAHEINNPIGAVNSMADTSSRIITKIEDLVKTSDINENEQFRKALTTLKNNHEVTVTASSRITRIVKSLKNFARLDEMEFQKTDIHEGIESTLTLVYHELKNKVTVNKEYGDIPQIYCFPNELNQVFINLLLNASHSIKDKGTITIKTSTDGSQVFISIADTGIGIPQDNLKKIFDPGFTTKGVGVGTGLGLSISYNIIKKHKGEIKVSSEVGRGTEFTIILPVKQNNHE